MHEPSTEFPRKNATMMCHTRKQQPWASHPMVLAKDGEGFRSEGTKLTVLLAELMVACLTGCQEHVMFDPIQVSCYFTNGDKREKCNIRRNQTDSICCCNFSVRPTDPHNKESACLNTPSETLATCPPCCRRALCDIATCPCSSRWIGNLGDI